MRPYRIAFVAGMAAVVVAALAASGAPAQITPEPCPRPGFVLVPGTDADRNGDTFVCVDETTGTTSDDVNPPSDQRKDANSDALVCYNADKGVVTDDRLSQDPNNPDASCPPGFVLVPVFPFL